MANDPEQLVALWKETRPLAPLPRVDFARYVVFGLSHQGSYCPLEISGVSADSSGVIRLYAEDEAILCVDVGTRVSLVVAVPRRLLKARALLVAPDFHDAYEFSVPPAPSQAASASGASRSVPAQPSHLEAVPLPARGHLALVTLRGGSQVWVAHEADGSLGVVSAVTSIARWSLERLPEYLLVPVSWQTALGRFQGGWDSQGHSVHGFAPLTPRYWQLDARGALWVGDPIEPLPGPIRARRLAPQLDGPSRAYQAPQRGAWATLRDGEAALVDWDLVSSPATGVRLCAAPKAAESAGGFRGCAPNAPEVMGAPKRPAGRLFALDGPFVVRRVGVLAEVIISNSVPQMRIFASQ
jgi:hypothetical protein